MSWISPLSAIYTKSAFVFELNPNLAKFIPENDIAPNWGKEQVVDYLKQISEGK